MAVVRLPGDGGLWVWSPVALTQEVRAAIDAVGPVRHLIAPNSLHHTFLDEWPAAYPDARVHAASGLSREVAGAEIHSTTGEEPDPAWGGVIDQVAVLGNRITTEVVFFHRPSASVLVTNLVRCLTPQDLDLLQSGSQRMTVIRVSREAAGSDDKPLVDGGDDADLRAELIASPRLTLRDAINLLFMQGVDFAAAFQSLLQQPAD